MQPYKTGAQQEEGGTRKGHGADCFRPVQALKRPVCLGWNRQGSEGKEMRPGMKSQMREGLGGHCKNFNFYFFVKCKRTTGFLGREAT